MDDEGIRAFRAIRRFEELLSGRQVPSDAADLTHDADGLLLQRWFVKHAINLFVASGSASRRWPGGSAPIRPPRQIIEAAFGLVEPKRPVGLYHWAAGRIGEQRIIGDQVGFDPYFDRSNEFAGARLDFQALNFLIWFREDAPRADLSGTPVTEFYHHMGGIFQAPPLTAHFRIHWPGLR